MENYLEYLNTRKTVIEYKKIISHEIKMRIGTPQVSPISPILFNIFVNDLYKLLLYSTNESKIMIGALIILLYMFADDTIIIHNDVKQMQKL